MSARSTAVRRPDAAVARPVTEASDGRILEQPRDRVVIFEDGEHFARLAGSVADLGLVPCDGNKTDLGPGVLAAVVSQRQDAEFTLCRDIATRVPVVVLCQEATFDARLAAARAGARAVVEEPVDIVELGAWFDGFDDTKQPTPMVMIVDDDLLLSEVYAATLEAAGMRAHVVNDPTRALAEVEVLAPDLVLLDIEMPDVNGLELARVIRLSRANISLPVTFLSAKRDAALQQLAREIGGDDFITKPVDLERLAAVVRMRAERAIALRQIMERDSLTGLLNHARFKERLGLELDRSRRTRSPLCVCLLDIDMFKGVNDKYGHQVGDAVIQTLSHALTGGLRRTDVVARYGGEEFALILLDTDIANAAVVLNRIRERFSRITLNAPAEAFHATFSAGIVEMHEADRMAALLALADERLYAAKRAGRNRVFLGKD